MPQLRAIYQQMQSWTLTVILLMIPLLLWTQTDTTLILDEVEITAQRILLTDIGKHADKIDSQALALRHHDHLGSLLSANSPLFIRSYGSGTLATLGIRGGGATHTQILWNGIPLRNPMLGLVDLALMPAAFIDEAAIHYGGHGAAFGSGAVGGLISIANNKLSDVDQIKIGFAGGSWKNQSAQVQVLYGLKKLRFSTRFFHHAAENNYRYKLVKDQPDRTQVHHQLRNHGLLQEVLFNINQRQSVTARFWYQNTSRQIPPLSTQSASQAAQQDESYRTSIQWNHNGEKIQLQLKTAWLDETINYQDTLILLYTNNRFKTFLSEAEAAFYVFNNLHLTAGIFSEISQGTSANYLETETRKQTALFATARWRLNDWNLRFQMREELTDGVLSPLLLDAAAEWSFRKNLIFKTSLSRNYRTPTLNDLHWRPGGNPDLIPERGWTYEGGIHFQRHNGSLNFHSSLTAYTRRIDNWIMWMPPVKDVSNFWSPLNIAIVKSYGIESRLKSEINTGNILIGLRGALDLTWSRFGTDLSEFNIVAGEQLFYVPIENVLAGFTIRSMHATFFYDHHWFGPSPGINDDLAASNIGSTGITINSVPKRFNGSFFVMIENVWNVPYRIIERRPMPGRSYAAGVKFTFSSL